MKRWSKILFCTARNGSVDNVFKHAAAVSFYTLFSMAPIVIIAVSVSGLIFGDAAAQGRLGQELVGIVDEERAI